MCVSVYGRVLGVFLCMGGCYVCFCVWAGVMCVSVYGRVLCVFVHAVRIVCVCVTVCVHVMCVRM